MIAEESLAPWCLCVLAATIPGRETNCEKNETQAAESESRRKPSAPEFLTESRYPPNTAGHCRNRESNSNRGTTKYRCLLFPPSRLSKILPQVNYRRLMQEATQAAPNPLSILTTVTLDAQELSMPSSAATPPKLAP